MTPGDEGRKHAIKIEWNLQSKKQVTLTCSSIAAKVSQTGISLVLAHLSLEALWTVAGVTVDAVNAGAPILAAVNSAVVFVHLTVGS